MMRGFGKKLLEMTQTYFFQLTFLTASAGNPCSNDRCPWDRKPCGGMKVRNVNQVGVHSRNHNHQPSKKRTTSK